VALAERSVSEAESDSELDEVLSDAQAATEGVMADESVAAAVAAETTAEAEVGWDAAAFPNVHNAITWLARHLLGSRAKDEVKQLVGRISRMGAWADTVKFDPAYAWSADLHFINIPGCEYEPGRDCRNSAGEAGFCADGAIQNYTMRLANPFLDSEAKAEALRFLLHLVGDIHQPLHVSGDQKGGVGITGTFMRTSGTNLHVVWDALLLKQRTDYEFAGNFTRYCRTLLKRIKHGRYAHAAANDWLRCSRDAEFGHCSDQWARESARIGCEWALTAPDGVSKIGDGFVLGVSYYERSIPIVERQIAKAAVRLANVLTQIWPDVEVVNPHRPKWTNRINGGVNWVVGEPKSRRLPRPASWTMGSGWPVLPPNESDS